MKAKLTKKTLPNGIRLLIRPMPSSKMVTLLVMVGAGSKYERSEEAGISHFLEHMFFKATKKRPTTKEIAEYLDEIGADYNAYTGKEYTGFYAKVAKDHTTRAFDFMADILSGATFPADEIEREKGVILEEMKMYQDTPIMYVSELFEKLLYGNQPAGRLVIGAAETVSAMRRTNFIDYLKRLYVPANMVVCVSGAISAEEAISLANKYFKKFRGGTPDSKVPVEDNQNEPAVFLHKKKTDQTHLCIGVRAYDVFHPDRFALDILSVVLGGGMSSRLFLSVREKLGLAYYIKASSDAYTDSGYLMIQAGVDNKRSDRAISVILKELRKIKRTPIGARELRKAKEYYKGRLLNEMENSDGLAAILAREEILTGKAMTASQIFAKIEAVTGRDILRVAKDILANNKLNLALIGPIADKKKYQKILKI